MEADPQSNAALMARIEALERAMEEARQKKQDTYRRYREKRKETGEQFAEAHREAQRRYMNNLKEDAERLEKQRFRMTLNAARRRLQKRGYLKSTAPEIVQALGLVRDQETGHFIAPTCSAGGETNRGVA